MKQDVIAVASILDAILARMTKELPNVNSFYILSDNAGCYQIDVLPVIAPFIARSHGLCLSGIVHSETQRGKSLLDAHFAIAMMHINRYCQETRKDVTTPGDIVEALNSFEGIANCTAEMVHISRSFHTLTAWRNAKGSGKLVKLGRVNEVKYGQWDCDTLPAACFRLSGRSSKEYIFGDKFSKPFDATAEDQSSSLTDHENEDEVVLEDIEVVTDVPIEERPSEVSFRSQLTGISVWSRVRLRRQRKKRKTLSNDVMEEQTEYLLQENLNEGEDTETNIPGEGLPALVMYKCCKCKKTYRREDFYLKHKETCSFVFTPSSVVSRAALLAFEMLKESDISIYTTRQEHPATASMTIDNDTYTSKAQKQGWAQRPRYGQTLGRNTVNIYSKDITEWFEAGQREKGKKMSPSRMREMIKWKHPGRYDVPSEHFIAGFLSTLVRKHKESVQNMVNENAVITFRSRRNGMETRYSNNLSELLSNNSELMPRHGRSALIQSLGLDADNLPSDFPSETSIKTKVSSLRRARRQDQLTLVPPESG